MACKMFVFGLWWNTKYQYGTEKDGHECVAHTGHGWRSAAPYLGAYLVSM